jgi:acetoin utilization protein AcuB
MTVGKRMTHNPITVSPDTKVTEAMALLKKEHISRLPVLDKHNKLVGIVTEFDLTRACPAEGTCLDMWELNYLLSKLTVDKVMATKVITITEDTTVEEAARLMVDNGISGLPIMRGEMLVGIITESDLFRLFIELFGMRKKGIRATLLLPEKQGELADVARAISDRGGNIVSFVTSLGDDPSHVLATLKVQGIDKDCLISIVAPHVDEIVDVREM